MTSLFETLQDRDLGYLRIVAELWGLSEPTQSGPEGARAIVTEIMSGDTIREICEGLPPQGRDAFDALLERAGRAPWTDFVREFGPIRQVGPGRRDRERHWRSPQSSSEVLWYRALIGREFHDTATGPREFAYVPDDILSRLAPASPGDRPVLSQPAPQPEHVATVSSRLIDDSVTILAALRQRPAQSLPLPSERQQAIQKYLFYPRAVPMLTILLRARGAIRDVSAEVDPDSAGEFMTRSRSSALHDLGQTWRDSLNWNDLTLVENLEAPAGTWPNDPVAARGSILLQLEKLDRETWWDTTSFIQSIRERDPGFARPGGEFQSWYLRDRSSGRFLRGFEHWEAIEGALIHRLITGPLHWLGAVELGTYSSSQRGLAFRLTSRFDSLLDGSPCETLPEDTVSGLVQSTGIIRLPRMVSRSVRYGVARMSAWVERNQDEFVYRLTPRTLDRAVRQGLTARHLQKLLEEAGGGAAPPALLNAVEAHAVEGARILLEHGLVVKFHARDLMESLLGDRRIAGLILERLGERAALVRESQIERFLDACAHHGVLAQPPGASDSP